MRIFIANIGWMTDYKGQSDADRIQGGGSYADTHKHEVYNFREIEGFCYGYVQIGNGKPNFSRIDKKYTDKEKISDVLVVWVATNPAGRGEYIVGWYKNATLYSTYQELSGPSAKLRSGYAFNIISKASDCVLLPLDERTFNFKRGKGYLGQRNFCFLDSDRIDVQIFRKKVIDYIIAYKKSSVFKMPYLEKPNTELNKKIEKAAIDTVTSHYRSLGYRVIDRQKDKCGWDLEATFNDIKLYLEVKGNASSEAHVRISRNEYEAMKNNFRRYRLCVVTNALKTPQLYVFAHNGDGKWTWEEDSRLSLNLDEQIAAIARFSVESLE